MPSLTVTHESGLASTVRVRGHEVTVDVPQQMGGEDRGPTPVDLLAASLGSCVAVYIARYCREAGVPHQGFEIEVDYVHDTEASCVPVLKVRINMPADFPQARRAAVMKVAQHCTVHNTLCLLPQIEMVFAHPG